MLFRSYVIADKGYDSQALREHLEARGSQPVIPRRKNNTRAERVNDIETPKLKRLVSECGDIRGSPLKMC